jgi:hypothetical protein
MSHSHTRTRTRGLEATHDTPRVCRTHGTQPGPPLRLQALPSALLRTSASSTSSTSFGSSPSPPLLPVVLLSNDNAQIAAAKSHGLPAFRCGRRALISSWCGWFGHLLVGRALGPRAARLQARPPLPTTA